MAITLQDLGWNDHFQQAFDALAKPGWIPGRLIRETKINFTALLNEGDDIDVVVSGKLWHDAATDADLPAVGDWVAIDPGKEGEESVIRAILPRQTCFSRKAPGKSSAEQVLGANVDIVAVVTEPGADFNPRRMERYFTLIHRSGAMPLILLNKVDMFTKEEVQEATDILRGLSPDCHIVCISALHKKGIKDFRKHIAKGKTISFVGSSGVGKSTLVNTLLGDEWLWTGEVNEVTGKGRHTTVARELVLLKHGGLIIDNPGMREIQMWTNEQTLRESFADLTELTHECRFADCSHGKDAGCAIRKAVEEGRLDEERYRNFLNLEQEIALLVKRQKKRQMNVERAGKRDRKVKARNYEDRVDLERHHRPNHRTHHD